MVVPVLVREVMQTPVATVDPDCPLVEIADRLSTEGQTVVVVVADATPVGIITRTDLLDVFATSGQAATQVAEDAMSAPIVTVSESAPIQLGAETLYEHEIDQALVMEGETMVGLFRAIDLVPFLPDSTIRPPEGTLEAEEQEWEYEYDDEASPGISVGDVVRFSKPISERDLELFAEISGDKNPLHLDEVFAEGTRFKRRIAHGALVSGVISAALSKLPGLVIYLSQNVSYTAPVDIGDRITARCEVISDLGNDRYRLSVEETDQDGNEVIGGEATVLVDPLPDDGQRE